MVRMLHLQMDHCIANATFHNASKYKQELESSRPESWTNASLNSFAKLPPCYASILHIVREMLFLPMLCRNNENAMTKHTDLCATMRTSHFNACRV